MFSSMTPSLMTPGFPIASRVMLLPKIKIYILIWSIHQVLLRNLRSNLIMLFRKLKHFFHSFSLLIKFLMRLYLVFIISHCRVYFYCLSSFLTIVKHFFVLTLFRMGWTKRPPCQFFPSYFYKRKN